jgi:hypothetical protein
MLCCASLGPAICCVVLGADSAAIGGSSALQLTHPTAARDERE